MKVSIGSLLQKRALMHPQKEALVDVEQGKRLTYEGARSSQGHRGDIR